MTIRPSYMFYMISALVAKVTSLREILFTVLFSFIVISLDV